VTETYRKQYIETYDQLLALWDDEFESYADYSAAMRQQFCRAETAHPIPSPQRGPVLLSPVSERLRRTRPESLPRFGPYRMVMEPPENLR